MSDINDIDNVRYSFESQEFFQRQLEQSVNELINKNNTESDKLSYGLWEIKCQELKIIEQQLVIILQ